MTYRKEMDELKYKKVVLGLEELINSNYDPKEKLKKFNKIVAPLTNVEKKRAWKVLEIEEEFRIREKAGLIGKGIPVEELGELSKIMNEHGDPLSLWKFMRKFRSGKYFKK